MSRRPLLVTLAIAALIARPSGGAPAPTERPEQVPGEPPGGVAPALQHGPLDKAHVSLPAGLELEDLLPQLQVGPIHVVVADASALQPRLGKPLREVTLRDALGEVSVQFDRYWIQRGGTLALQRRFGDPEEEPGVEMEELGSAANDLYTLVRPFCPSLPNIDYILRQNRFAASLSPELQERLTKGGLPLAALPRNVREAWLQINAAHAYSSGTLELERAARCFGIWNQAMARDLVPGKGRRMQLTVEFPDPVRDDGTNSIDSPVPYANVRPYVPLREGVELPKSQAPAPRDLRPPWPVTCHVFELGTLVREVGRAGGPKITVPSYAAHRKVLVSSDGTRAEVLSALTDLYGWELAPEKDGYHLGRARATPARSPAELHVRMLHAIPPPVWHSAMAVRRSCTARWARQMEYVLQDADHVAGPDWKRFRVADLTPLNQRRFANILMSHQVGVWYTLSGGQEAAPPWIVAPERGILRLSAPIRPGEHPLLKFEVPDENGKTYMWGYYVGTSSFDK